MVGASRDDALSIGSLAYYANGRAPYITVGRHQLVFHVCTQIERLPTRWHETPDGRFRVATPELAALQIVQKESQLGGMARVREVLGRLYPACTPEGLTQALQTMDEVPTAQRLGSLTARDEQEALASAVAEWLADRTFRVVPRWRSRAGASISSGSHPWRQCGVRKGHRRSRPARTTRFIPAILSSSRTRAAVVTPQSSSRVDGK